MVEGSGIATARALIESPRDVANLSLADRETVVMYYKVRVSKVGYETCIFHTFYIRTKGTPTPRDLI